MIYHYLSYFILLYIFDYGIKIWTCCELYIRRYFNHHSQTNVYYLAWLHILALTYYIFITEGYTNVYCIYLTIQIIAFREWINSVLMDFYITGF